MKVNNSDHPSTLRLMTWNIRLGIQNGLDPIAEVIRSRQPDIVALQEIGKNWTMGPTGNIPALLATMTALPHLAWSPSIDLEGGAQYGHAVLSAHPIVEEKVIELPRAIDEPRTLLDLRIRCPHGLVRVIATHLSHIEDRQEQADFLVRYMEGIAEPAILLGDLNEDQSPWLERLALTFFDADGSLKRPTYPAEAPAQRIDRIFVNHGSITDVAVLDTGERSDHLPVVADLLLPG